MAEQRVNRSKTIVRASITGIVVNCLLAGFKAFVGFLSNSVAIILDAVNNFSDALSSVITIIGTKLAGKTPDKKHPLGYGRIEYLSAMIIAGIVLYAGGTSLVESCKKIIWPETVDYSTVTLVIVAVAVVVKLVLGQYVKKTGEKVHSDALVESGADAVFDSVLSLSVLVSAIIYLVFKVNLEAYVGVFIACFIIKAGIEMLMDTLDEILGKRASQEFTDAVKETICEEEQVGKAYDLILHSYGPERYTGSVHVEVPEDMKAADIDALERRIAARVYEKHGIIMTGIGIYAVVTKNKKLVKLRDDVISAAESCEGVIQAHGYFCDDKEKTISLDVIIDYDIEDRAAVMQAVREKLTGDFPKYTFSVVQDIDI
ncbi:MAG: cation diffusion facilitator family transporter [Lachnospiraceae bacterium]|nr:cation diffusion facilitator family transporter [Lachnospiraceae bacterium]